METFELIITIITAAISGVIAYWANTLLHRAFAITTRKRQTIKLFKELINQFCWIFESYEELVHYMPPCSYNLREDLTESYQQLIDFYNDNRTILVNKKAVIDSLEQVVAFASMFSDKNILLGQLPEKCDTQWYKRNKTRGTKIIERIQAPLSKV